MLYKDAIAQAMVDALRSDDRVVILGQNATTPHGVFGTLSEAARAFPERVLEIPISETMITGACVGLAMEGWKPILVHTRADFSLFSFEHLINTAAKFNFLHKEPLPFVMRCIVGRGWGQGPVHSQSFHHLLAQIPGLNVFMPAFPSSYAWLVDSALHSKSPTIIVEPRRLYETTLVRQEGSPIEAMLDTADITFFTYGDAAIDAFEAAQILARHDIAAYVYPIEDLSQYIPPLKRGLIIDIAPRRFELGILSPPFIPQGVSQPYERLWYPTASDIVKAACKMLGKEPPKEEEHGNRSPAVRSAF